MHHNALLLLETDFEEIEAITTIDLLRRAHIPITTASVHSSLQVSGKHSITITADTLLSTINPSPFSTLILPGGPAVNTLRKNTHVLQLVQSFHQHHKLIAAICAAPLILLEAGILPFHNITAHPSTHSQFPNHSLSPLPTVINNNIITSQGPATTISFALAIIEKLTNHQTASSVSSQICLHT